MKDEIYKTKINNNNLNQKTKKSVFRQLESNQPTIESNALNKNKNSLIETPSKKYNNSRKRKLTVVNSPKKIDGNSKNSKPTLNFTIFPIKTIQNDMYNPNITSKSKTSRRKFEKFYLQNGSSRKKSWPFSNDSLFLSPTTLNSSISSDQIHIPRYGHLYRDTKNQNYLANSMNLDCQNDSSGSSAEGFEKDYLLNNEINEDLLLQKFNLQDEYILFKNVNCGNSSLLFGGGQSSIYLLTRKESRTKVEFQKKFILKVYSSVIDPTMSLSEVDILTHLSGNTKYVPKIYNLEVNLDYDTYQHAIVLEYVESIPFINIFFHLPISSSNQFENLNYEDFTLNSGSSIASSNSFGEDGLSRSNGSSNVNRNSFVRFEDRFSDSNNSLVSNSSNSSNSYSSYNQNYNNLELFNTKIRYTTIGNTMDTLKLYLFKLLHALKDIHDNNVIHRDIKPPNVLFHPGSKSLHIIDFGGSVKGYTQESKFCYKLRRYQKYPSKTVFAHHTFYGTAGFIAPETILGIEFITSAVDIWACGVIFLSVLSQRYPVFTPQDDHDLLAELICYLHVQNDLKKLATKYSINFEIDGIPPGYNPENSRVDIFKSFCEVSRELANDLLKDRFQDSIDIFHDVPERDMINAYNLVSRLLDIDPESRITAEDALKHPFFEGFNP